jgi:hypothetical protein
MATLKEQMAGLFNQANDHIKKTYDRIKKTRTWFAITTVWHSFFYLVVVCLCILGGAAANPNFTAHSLSSSAESISNILASKDAAISLILVLMFFFCYFVSRLALLDRPPRSKNDEHKQDDYGFGLGEMRASRFFLPLIYIVASGIILIALGWINHST